MKKNVWVLEDEDDMIEIYRDSLEEKYNLSVYKQIPVFLNEISKRNNKCDLAIIDLNIYNNNFLNHINDARLLRGFPFIIVSGNYEKAFIEKSFDYGAIDYIVKPFMSSELEVKISHYINKNKRKDAIQNIVEEFIETDDLTQKEIKILNLFANIEEHKLKRDQIIDNIWKGIKVHPKTLDVHLYNLRKKIKERGLFINCIDGVFHLEASSQEL